MQRVHRLSDLPAALQVAIHEGAQGNQLCPACNGGRTGELSLGIFYPLEPGPTGAVGLKCYRAGCGYSARVVLDGSVVLEPPRFKPRVFGGILRHAGVAEMERLYKDYGILPETSLRFGVKRAEERAAFYLPVLGPHGAERGGIMRYFDGREPKAVAYKHTDEPFQAWYIPDQKYTECVIVEDQYSAMRATQLGYDAVALIGTNLNYAKAAEIVAYLAPKEGATGPGLPRALLALDRDAFGLACKYAKRYRGVLELTPILLDRDLKDISDEEIEERLTSCKS